MWNPDDNPDPEFRKKNFQRFFLFNSKQILFIAFFKKMAISAKKVCFLHFSYLPGNIRTDVIEIGNKAVKMAESLTMRKPAQFFFREKNRIRKIWEKIRISKSYFLGQILRMDTINYCFIA